MVLVLPMYLNKHDVATPNLFGVERARCVKKCSVGQFDELSYKGVWRTSNSLPFRAICVSFSTRHPSNNQIAGNL